MFLVLYISDTWYSLLDWQSSPMFNIPICNYAECSKLNQLSQIFDIQYLMHSNTDWCSSTLNFPIHIVSQNCSPFYFNYFNWSLFNFSCENMFNMLNILHFIRNHGVSQQFVGSIMCDVFWNLHWIQKLTSGQPDHYHQVDNVTMKKILSIINKPTWKVITHWSSTMASFACVWDLANLSARSFASDLSKKIKNHTESLYLISFSDMAHTFVFVFMFSRVFTNTRFIIIIIVQPLKTDSHSKTAGNDW